MRPGIELKSLWILVEFIVIEPQRELEDVAFKTMTSVLLTQFFCFCFFFALITFSDEVNCPMGEAHKASNSRWPPANSQEGTETLGPIAHDSSGQIGELRDWPFPSRTLR